MPEPLIFGNRSMDTVRRPLCGCFVLSCMVGGIFRKPLDFRRCLPPARPEKAKPFQAGQSPCTKHQQTVRLRLYALKKVFEGSKGRFLKNAPLAGCGTASHKRRASHHRDAPFQAGQGPCTKHRQTVRLCLYAPKKVFEGSKGRFFKNAPLAGRGTASHKEVESQSGGTPFRERQGSTEKGRKRSSREKENEMTVEQLYEALEERFPRSRSCMWGH